MVSLLLGNPYFSSCNPKNISYIQYYFSQKAYLRGQIICNVGDLVKNVYFVQEGELDVCLCIYRLCIIFLGPNEYLSPNTKP